MFLRSRASLNAYEENVVELPGLNTYVLRGNWVILSHFLCLDDDMQVLFKFGGDPSTIIIPGFAPDACHASARGSLPSASCNRRLLKTPPSSPVYFSQPSIVLLLHTPYNTPNIPIVILIDRLQHSFWAFVILLSLCLTALLFFV
jgi:hypothetical protein